MIFMAIRSSKNEMQKIMTERAKAFRKAHMRSLRELKKKVDEMERIQSETAKHHREILSAQLKATRDMHRSMRGIAPKKKGEK